MFSVQKKSAYKQDHRYKDKSTTQNHIDKSIFYKVPNQITILADDCFIFNPDTVLQSCRPDIHRFAVIIRA
ncbi:hypothetical protein D3C80_1585420 [compost metagenome]